MRRVYIGLFVSMLAFPVWAATFEPEKTVKFGKWETVLYRNLEGNRIFCAAETFAGNETYFRINQYKDTGEAFLELYNSKWNLMDGNMRFRLDVTVGDEVISTQLPGRSWGDSLTYDFISKDIYTMLLDIISVATSIELKDNNGTVLANFDGNGSDMAIPAYLQCTQK